ncbi:MAG: ATP-grasp domain-containing protein [Candidatus Acidiferrales bacterium]
MNVARKKLLILASKLGYQTRGFAEAAESLGIEIHFATDRCHKLDDPWGDGALPLHFENPQDAAKEIVTRFASDQPDAILALGDRPTPTAAYAARTLGISGNYPEAVERCRSKLAQREALRAAGLPVPKFWSFTFHEPVESVTQQVKFPCVLKPLFLAASQGVIRADNEMQFRAALSRIHLLLESPAIQVTREPSLDRVLVEEYIPGREVAVEGLLDHGQLEILAIFDKPDALEGPYFEETIYVTPSRLAKMQQSVINDCAARAIHAIGLTHGPVHAEFRINEQGPWVLEIAPRPIGGLCSRALRFGPQRISLEELLLRHALVLGGANVEREPEASGVMMIPVPRSGTFERVEGLEDAGRVPGVTEILITARLKDYVAAWPEGSSYLGFIFARAKTPNEAEAALRAAHAKLSFEFSPRLPVEHPITGRISA